MDQRHSHRYLSSLCLVSRMKRYSAMYRRKRWKNYLQLNLQVNDVEEWCRRLLYIIYVGFSLVFEDIKIVRYEIKEGRCLCGSASLFRWHHYRPKESDLIVWNCRSNFLDQWMLGKAVLIRIAWNLELLEQFLFRSMHVTCEKGKGKFRLHRLIVMPTW